MVSYRLPNICKNCIWWLEHGKLPNVCKAFPKGIDNIIYKEEKHTLPLENQKNILIFEPIRKEVV